MKDQRPDPKPRKNAHLWQAYLIWDELVKLRQRHTLRISSIEAGKSNLDLDMEYEFLAGLNMDQTIEHYKKQMINYGATLGPVWDWITSIKGLKSGSLAAQVLAQIDDIGKFDTVSKLWRFSGYAVIDGKAERNKKGEKSRYNRRLKSTVYLVSESFLKQQTELYVDLYYEEKKRGRERYPEPVVIDGKKFYTDGHLHNRAMRRMSKMFLSHLWLQWRESDGLPVSLPYAHALMGHTNLVQPADMVMAG